MSNARTGNILLCPGDGVGIEIAPWITRFLAAIGERHGYDFQITEVKVGGQLVDVAGVPITPGILDQAEASDAVFLIAVGGPKWDSLPMESRPEQAIFQLRKRLDTFANFRPAKVFPQLQRHCPLRPEIASKGIDILFVREMVSGAYFGEPREQREGALGLEAIDTIYYNEEEIRRVAHKAFRAAMERKRHVTSVDKSNALETGRLWRHVVTEVAREYPEVRLDHQLVDAMAMKLLAKPHVFDVVLTSNLLGDILTDEACILTGSLGLMPSASVSNRRTFLYEPIHGSAPDIAGQGQANPIGCILALAWMLRLSFDLPEAAAQVERAVESVLDAGLRTPDIADGDVTCTTSEMAQAILDRVI